MKNPDYPVSTIVTVSNTTLKTAEENREPMEIMGISRLIGTLKTNIEKAEKLPSGGLNILLQQVT